MWEGRGPWLPRRVEYGFEPNGDGTRFTYINEYDLPGGPLGRLAGADGGAGHRTGARRSLQRLKALVE